MIASAASAPVAAVTGTADTAIVLMFHAVEPERVQIQFTADGNLFVHEADQLAQCAPAWPMKGEDKRAGP